MAGFPSLMWKCSAIIFMEETVKKKSLDPQNFKFSEDRMNVCVAWNCLLLSPGPNIMPDPYQMLIYKYLLLMFLVNNA